MALSSTSLMVAGFFAVEATFITATAAFVLNAAVGMALSLGLSYAAKALSGTPAAGDTTSHFSAQGHAIERRRHAALVFNWATASRRGRWSMSIP